MTPRIAVCAVALGATLLVANDAFAAGGKGRSGRKRRQTLELTRPAEAPDPNAAGTVRIEHGRKGDQTVLQLDHLDPRTTYEVQDSATGQRIGDVRTNRKGRARFNLSKSLAKAVSSGGSDAGTLDDVGGVDIIDPVTGDRVLEGDVKVDPFDGFQSGYGDYWSEAGDSASIFMQSAPGLDEETFSLTFYSSRETFRAVYYDYYRDTLAGDALPLGVDSVTELAGRGFEIVAADGTVAVEGELPELQPWDDCVIAIDDPVVGDDFPFWEGEWDDRESGDGEWSGTKDPFDPIVFDDWQFGDANSFDFGGHDGTTKSARKGRRGGVKEEPILDDGYHLMIEDENGDLQDAGLIKEQSYDYVDCPIFDPGTVDDGIFVLFAFALGSDDGSFDWESLFRDLFGDGSSDPGNGGVGSDAAGAKHGGR